MKILVRVLFTACLLAGTARAQEENKVLDQLKLMEGRLQVLIEQEKKDREHSIEELAQMLQALKPPGQAAKTVDALSLTDMLALLKDGNARYVEGKLEPKDIVKERPALAEGQHPFAIILTCSDSRVPPEYIFDQSLGRLFVIRVAGNVLDSVALGSIEYAAEHLNTRLLVVLGHEKCGAVKAACEGGHFSPFIESITGRIAPAVKRARGVQPGKQVSAVVAENVAGQTRDVLEKSKVLRDLSEESKFFVQGAVYDLATGRVKFLENETGKNPKAVEAIKAFREAQEKNARGR